jgi:hypothetical protein
MPIYTPEEKATALARAHKQINDLRMKSDLDDLAVSSSFAEGYLQCLVNEGGLTAAEYETQQAVLDKALSKRREVLLAQTDH